MDLFWAFERVERYVITKILLHTPFVDNLFNCWRLFIDYQSFKEMGGRNVEMMKQILISELNFILDLSGNRRNFNFLVLSILNWKTVSTRWTTPLLAKTSVAITVAFPADDSMVTAPSALVTVISSPPTVFSTVLPAGISPALTGTGNTCLKRTAVRASLSSKRPPKASAGTLANASLVGAKTVNVPSPLRVSTRPAALTAVTRVDKLGVAIAAAAMLGNSASLVAGSEAGAAAKTVSMT